MTLEKSLRRPSVQASRSPEAYQSRGQPVKGAIIAA
jgi:hypothetical protein